MRTGNWAVNRDVHRAAWETSYDAVDRAVWDTVWEAVETALFNAAQRAVWEAVERAVDEDAPHHALRDFLGEVR